jgi:glutathione synthase/RimK-type ligase-like ATP-grasp enzyme
MKRLVLVPHSLGSRSAKALAEVLSEKVDHRVFRVKPQRVGKRIAFQLRRGTDKLTQLQKFKDAQVNCPDFTTDRDVAAGFIRDGHAVVCRTLLRGSEGRGIVVAESVEELVPAPLYTKYVKKKKEFRVHVLNGQVIDVQEKRKRKEFTDERNTRIRNVANGYVFCRDSVVEPTSLRELAISATRALGYNLGAVDIVWNERSDSLYVLEVNATPGMEGTTLQKYADAIVGWYRGQANGNA